MVPISGRCWFGGSEIDRLIQPAPANTASRVTRTRRTRCSTLSNAGLTLAESLGYQAGRPHRVWGFGNSGSGNGGNQLFGQRAKDAPFERLDLLAKLQKTAEVRFNDLAALAGEPSCPKPASMCSATGIMSLAARH